MKDIKYYLLESLDIRIIFVAVIYFLSAYFGLLLSFPDPITSPVWPPVGIGLALIILLGNKTWPGITIGSLLAYMLVFWLNGIAIDLAAIKASTLIAIGNTVEILIGQYLLNRFIKNTDLFKNTSDTFIFLLIALFMCLIGSSIGTYSFYLNGMFGAQKFIGEWFLWWIPNVTSVLLFTPFILSWKRIFRFKVSRLKIIEIIIFLTCLSIFTLILRRDDLALTIEKSFPFLVIPFLLWLSFRFNLQTAMTGILITSLFAIYITIYNLGPFVLDTNINSILILQIFISVISITSIILSSTVYERSDAQKTIKKFNETLEAKIDERTHALNEEINFRINAEDKLKVSNRQLRKANVELDNFVYKVSHDLRAPIASVLGLVNLAKNEKKYNVLREYFDMIGKSAYQQDLFIKDILDLSRNSRLIIKKDKIEWKKLISDTFDQLKYGVKDKDIIKQINIQGRGSFFSDQRRIKVIFNNLISNAIRYSNGKDPVIEIDIKINQIEADITISDNGQGIDKGHQKKVFEMFYRATDNNAGSGLGLYIVKESVDKLNGQINMHSEVGKGTKFYISLPNLKT